MAIRINYVLIDRKIEFCLHSLTHAEYLISHHHILLVYTLVYTYTLNQLYNLRYSNKILKSYFNMSSVHWLFYSFLMIIYIRFCKYLCRQTSFALIAYVDIFNVVFKIFLINNLRICHDFYFLDFYLNNYRRYLMCFFAPKCSLLCWL